MKAVRATILECAKDHEIYLWTTSHGRKALTYVGQGLSEVVSFMPNLKIVSLDKD